MEHFGYEATRAHNYPHQMIFYDFRFGYDVLLHRWDEFILRGDQLFTAKLFIQENMTTWEQRQNGAANSLPANKHEV